MRRRIAIKPAAKFFKPKGTPMAGLEIIELSHEELEALRLKYVLGMSQNECAHNMHTSQSTFQRILASALRKTSTALTEGKSLKIIQ